MRERLQNIGIVAVSIVVTLLVAEWLVRLLTPFPIHGPMANRVLDERLLFRISSTVHGVDVNGFRNPPGHDKPFPRIAAIGDSQTYGYNVEREESWPARLEMLLGEKVYNLGIGNYSYLNYAAAAEYALERGAKTLIIGTHPINDMEVCLTAPLGYWVRAFEAAPEIQKLMAAACGGKDGKLVARNAYDILASSERMTLWRRIRDQSALSSLFRHVSGTVLRRRDTFGGIRLKECQTHPKDFIFKTDKLDDLIPYPQFAELPPVTALDDKLIGFTVARIARMAEARGAKVYILVLPSRMRIVVDHLKSASPATALPEWLKAGIAYEERETAFVRKAAEANGIPFGDTTAETVKAYATAAREGRTFFPCTDTHPLAEGYAAYARMVADLVRGR